MKKREITLILLSMNTTREELINDIDAFIQRTGMSAASFGLAVARDNKLVSRLRSGRDILTGTADKIRDFMASYENKNNRPACGGESNK